MRAQRLNILPSTILNPTTDQDVGEPAPLGVFSVHFEGGRCRVRCPFCYLGQRAGAVTPAMPSARLPVLGQLAAPSPSNLTSELDVDLVVEALGLLNYRELAVTLSEPIAPLLMPLSRLSAAAAQRGRPVAITTTLSVCRELLGSGMDVLDGVSRLNLSIDPWKGQWAAAPGQVEVSDIAAALSALRQRFAAERVLILTLSTPRFAAELFDGLLAALLQLPDVDRLALNALKPPPPWCDRDFWLRGLSALQPLLRQHLDRRLFLDCYVAARILKLGGCPARPDLSPAPGQKGVAFRSCVYQPDIDFLTESSQDLSQRLRSFVAPAVCPFPIR